VYLTVCLEEDWDLQRPLEYLVALQELLVVVAVDDVDLLSEVEEDADADADVGAVAVAILVLDSLSHGDPFSSLKVEAVASLSFPDSS